MALKKTIALAFFAVALASGAFGQNNNGKEGYYGKKHSNKHMA